MKNFFRLFVALSAVLMSSPAHADLNNTYLFTLNTIYIDRDTTDNGIKTKSKTTDTDIRLGKVFRSYYAGLIYSQSANDAAVSNRTSYGLSGGYYSERDLYMVAHYFFSSKNSLNGGFSEDRGTGFEIDLGGLFRFTSSFYLGLIMAYKTFSYNDRTINSVSSSTSVSSHELMPLFTVGFALQ